MWNISQWVNFIYIYIYIKGGYKSLKSNNPKDKQAKSINRIITERHERIIKT